MRVGFDPDPEPLTSPMIKSKCDVFTLGFGASIRDGQFSALLVEKSKADDGEGMNYFSGEHEEGEGQPTRLYRSPEKYDSYLVTIGQGIV